eukprot:CAMPEP_0113672822 /NCGR_PEP_ID=MMETSP0038_2-20120614/6501_1 /TAXON_ID=2898 /ORGANISM="Cryptomonas paramecium" /LENGTH=432 /DNA_ID=CAMNT_0000589183 /DNA_START=387 /DNA_END=1685 /DNA_ORIENTATION=- /assembly_acc=CAM_ASM_000170
MSGTWSVFDRNIEKIPEVKTTYSGGTRLLLEHESGLVSMVSAMTLQHGNESLYDEKRKALGQDPLRPDADVELLWNKVNRCRKSIAQIIMDQSYFAGPGNIYRAEILFKAGVFPNVKGIELSRAQFDDIWRQSVTLLRRGFETGSMLTVDPEEAVKLGKPNMRRYIYNMELCGRCSGPVMSWRVAGRTCYACPQCQDASGCSSGSSGSENVASSLVKKSTLRQQEGSGDDGPAAGTVTRVFTSRCAEETLEERARQGPDKLRVWELREMLQIRGLDTRGTKPMLAARLRTYEDDAAAAGDIAAIQPSKLIEGEDQDLSIGVPASPMDAAREKARAGESRAVEHVADIHPSQARRAASSVAGEEPTRNPLEGHEPKTVGSGINGHQSLVGDALGARQTKRRRVDGKGAAATENAVKKTAIGSRRTRRSAAGAV